MIRAITTLFVATGLLVPAAAANAQVVPRLADLESVTSAPYEFDQLSKRCATTIAARDTTLAYSGNASLKVHTQNDPACGGAYARGLFRANSTRRLLEGDDFWFGTAIYLPTGFYAAHTGYTDLLRLDSYVNDDSTSVPFADRAEINLASWSNDALYLRAARGGTQQTLIGPLSPSAIPEGTWSWVEVHTKLSSITGIAYTELKVDGESLGTSIKANLFTGAAPLNRLRYGIVSTAVNGSGDLTAYFDRASINPTERGPIQPETPEDPETEPETEPESPGPEHIPSRVGLWRLGETSGTVAADAVGSAPGVYLNGPTLGVPGIAGDNGDTAVSFDGVDDHVAIAPTPSLDLVDGMTLEAWFTAKTLVGSMIHRNNAYELRPQGNGNILMRVWIDGVMRTLTAGAETVPPEGVHHLVGTYDGASMKIYLDGIEVASRPQTGQMTHGSDPLYIGRNSRMDTYFSGTIDEVSIYSEALSADAVLDRFASGRTGLGS
jgi:hypothetical protein